jgi:hypothetical protein
MKWLIAALVVVCALIVAEHTPSLLDLPFALQGDDPIPTPLPRPQTGV